MNVFDLLMPVNTTREESIKEYDLDNDNLIQNPPKKKEEEELDLNLNIDEYDYFELLKVFQIKNINKNEDLVHLREYVNKIEESCIDEKGTITKKKA